MSFRFPDTFCLGTTSTAFQIEGGCNARGRSIWDAFTRIDGKIIDSSHAKVACNHYNLYKYDIQLMKQLGIQCYHFSISWCRILPTGRIDHINQEGVDYYNSLIDELIRNDITPSATLFCWDYPITLHKEYKGWLSPKSQDDFYDYAMLCFELFGDRIKRWATINEPWIVAVLGHVMGEHSPGKSDNPGVDPYLVMHNIILSHARVYRAFKSKYEGILTIIMAATWWHPGTRQDRDFLAAKRALTFTIGWTLDPLTTGDYPQMMKDIVGDRLPQFTEEEKKMIAGTYDYLGITHYTTIFAGEISFSRILSNSMSPSGFHGGENGIQVLKHKYHFFKDMQVMSLHKDISRTDMDLYIVPAGIRKILRYLKKHYNTPIYIYENGCGIREDSLNDDFRVKYLEGYLVEVHKAIQEGVDVMGYNVWSLLSNFEWTHGYSISFGLVHVNFETQKRTPKLSAYWYSRVCKTRSVG